MTIFNRARLKAASWRGVKFSYVSCTVTGGRKTQTHEYPDTDVRYVEDLGKLERTYNVEAVIDTNVSFSKRDKLLKQLEIGGLGELKLAPLKPIKKAVLKNYSFVDDTAQLGINRFTLVFEEASLNKLPSTTKGNKGFLDRLRDKIGADNIAAFENGFQAVMDAKDAFDSAVDTVRNFASELQNVAALVSGAADSISDAVSAINEVVDGAKALVQSPRTLATKVRASFNNLLVAYNSSKDVFTVMRSYFGFNGADRNIVGNSARDKQLRNNQNQLSRLFQTSALSVAYSAAVNIDFKSVDELSEVISQLEDGFNQLPDGIDRGIYQDLLNMRIETNNIFNRLSISLPKLTDFETNKVSLNVLTYSLYGSLVQKNNLRDLNNFLDTSAVEGQIKILSNA